MGTKTASRLLILVLSAGFLAGSAGHGTARPLPVAIGSEIRVFGADAEHVRLVRWAAERFETSGMGHPPVEVHFHEDTTGCLGHLGSQLGRRVDVCVPHVSEIARETLLHEMGHAWIRENLTESLAERFMEMRGLREWNAASVDWDERGFEHGAEIIAWALGNRYLAPTIPDREPARLEAAFELLTGLSIPQPETVQTKWLGSGWVPSGQPGYASPGYSQGVP